MQQFRAGVDAVVWLDRPWKLYTDGTGLHQFPAANTDTVRMYYKSPSAVTGYVVAVFDGSAQTWAGTIPNASQEDGIWQFYTLDMTDTDAAKQYGTFEWGGNYETICAAADASLANLDAIFAAAANAETDAATAAVQSTAGAADAATAATQATIAATQSTIAASQSTAGAASASTAATQSTNAAIDAAKAALNLSAGRFFQYTAGAVSPAPKSKLWLRNAADSGWAGYYPCYANLSTGGAWPLAWADVQWPTLYAGITSLGAFVADTAGPT